ncbi:Com family DNA-binding transcriptional regulator [Denitratisoma sp. agr-D3]
METIRCGSCNRKLAEADYTRLSIKCPRCGVLNHQVKAESPKPERHGASLSKETHRGHQKKHQPQDPAL